MKFALGFCNQEMVVKEARCQTAGRYQGKLAPEPELWNISTFDVGATACPEPHDIFLRTCNE